MRKGKRLPRFRRDTEAAAPMVVTPRDLEILRQVARHRFLRSTHVHRLLGGSPVQLNRRLKVLFHHGYLERPRAQLDYYHQGGSAPVVYGLGSRGAGLLRRELDMPFHRMDWSEKNRKVGRLFIEHAIMVSDIMVSVEMACRAETDIRMLTADDLPSHAPASLEMASARLPPHLKMRKQNVIPDAVFGLEWHGRPESGAACWFLVEADRGTMPVVRRRPDQTSIIRKIRAYEEAWTTGTHVSQMGIERFRVLFVTPSSERATHIMEAARSIRRAHGLFLVTDIAGFRGAADTLHHTWLSARGDGESLLS